jgi:DNA-binding CsgD family transcriptional regulator
MLEAFRRVCLELPDEAKRELRRLEMFHSSLAWKAYWSAAKASMDGDDAPIRAWAEERIGHKPDSILRVHLRKGVLADASPAETWAVADVRGAMRRREVKARGVEEHVEKVRAGIKRFPQLDLALEVLALSDQNHEQVLSEMIPGLAYELEPHVSDTELPGKVADQIRREGIGHPASRRIEIAELAAFANRERLLKWGRDVGLPPREYELFGFLVDNPGATNSEAAQTMGIAVGTVKSLKHRIKNTTTIA